MFYIFLFAFGYISLGLGVWIAMRHKEMLRRQLENKDQVNDTLSSWQTPPEEKLSDTEDSSIDTQPSEITADHQNASEPTHVEETLEKPQVNVDEPAQSNQFDDMTESTGEPQASGEMIEHLVGMVEEEEADELTGIVEQLQEIHHLASEADIRCYASEDAEFFITPDKEQYATTAICRPKVGRKSISDSALLQR
jgi:hypothetical protein